MNTGNMGTAWIINIKLNVDTDWDCYINSL